MLCAAPHTNTLGITKKVHTTTIINEHHNIHTTWMDSQAVYALWAQGSWLEDIHTAVRAMTVAEVESALPTASARLRLDVDTLGYSSDDATRVSMIHECLGCLPTQATVDLKNPTHHLWLLLAQPARHLSLEGMPQVAFLGLLVGESQQKQLNKRYTLSDRRYLGPTSMDTTLAFVMANMGHARKGALCADPFVGTGSNLIAAAALGAHVLGADIDMRVIKLGKVGSMYCWAQIWSLCLCVLE